MTHFSRAKTLHWHLVFEAFIIAQIIPNGPTLCTFPPPALTNHREAKLHLTETKFYILWVLKSPKNRCCSEKKCNKIIETPFSKMFFKKHFWRNISIIEAKLDSYTRSPFRNFGRPKKKNIKCSNVKTKLNFMFTTPTANLLVMSI